MRVSVVRVAVLLAVALGAGLVAVPAQKLPGGTVPTPPRKDGLRRAPKTALSKQPTSALLIVVTTPKAEIALNGRSVGSADAEGQFEKEVPAGQYQLRVSAGSDFAPSERLVVLKARQREIVSIDLESRLGSVVLGVSRLEGAAVFVDSSAVARFDERGNLAPAAGAASAPVVTVVTVDREKLTVTLSRVAAGAHTIRFECAGCEPVEESVTLRGGETQVLALRAGLAFATVEVVSDPGTNVLFNGARWGTTGPDGLFSGHASPGESVIRFERPGYEPAEQRRIFQPGETARVEQHLSPTLTTVGFGDDFELGLGRWEHPASWSVSDGALVVSNSPEPGLARGIYYGDFVFSFNLTLSSLGGAAWLVRARDPRNYYLFYLSGPGGRFPNRLAAYVVRDGKFEIDSPAIAPIPVVSSLQAGGEYYVEVTARGNRIETRITPLATGVPESLGEFVDPQALFPAGGIGFRSVQGEPFKVDDAYADPPGVR